MQIGILTSFCKHDTEWKYITVKEVEYLQVLKQEMEM